MTKVTFYNIYRGALQIVDKYLEKVKCIINKTISLNILY